MVTTVTHEREPYFSSLALGRCLVRVLIQAEAQGYAQTLAFAVMPDHLHWLCMLGDAVDLFHAVEWVKGCSSRAIGCRTGARRVWQPGFHDRAVRHDEDLRQLARYVVANPLRAGLVHTLGAYALWDAVWVGDRG